MSAAPVAGKPLGNRDGFAVVHIGAQSCIQACIRKCRANDEYGKD